MKSNLVDLKRWRGQVVAMASSKTLNAKNLEALGAERLASLLIEVSTGNSVAKRRLRLELAGAASGDDAAREIHKRITAIAKARTFIDWRRTKAMITDLEAQHRAIMNHVAAEDPREALALLWRFLGLASSIFARCDDGSGRVLSVFRDAVPALAALATASRATPVALAASVFEAVSQRNHGQWDAVIPTLAPHLGDAGLEELKRLVATWRADVAEAAEAIPSWKLGSAERDSFYRSQIERRHREETGRFVLEQIADTQGDVDAFIAQQPSDTLGAPKIAAGIARRLLDAGRAKEALAALERIDVEKTQWIPDEWDDARLDALEALGRADDAQAFRWERYGATLSTRHLRAWLRKLPGHEDFEGEERAFVHAASFPDIHRAAAFFMAWGALDRVQALLLARGAELDGDLYEMLTPLAEALETSYPLAATMILRSMIDFTLSRARATRYGYARQQLDDCRSLSKRIGDFGRIPGHAAYEEQLRAAHGRKMAFWDPET